MVNAVQAENSALKNQNKPPLPTRSGLPNSITLPPRRIIDPKRAAQIAEGNRRLQRGRVSEEKCEKYINLLF